MLKTAARKQRISRTRLAGLTAGYVLIAAAGMYALVSVFDRDHRELGWLPAAVVALVVGAGLVLRCTMLSHIEKVNRPADEAWEDGYEVGFDKGWRERDARERPVLRGLPSRTNRDAS